MVSLQTIHSGVPTEGSVLDGVYRVERVIGTGSMGAVLAAEDLTLGRRVALKVLRRDVVQHADAVLRFRREARAIARLRSPYAVRLHGFGVLDDDTCYLVMELVDGEALTRIIRRDAPLPLPRALGILRKIAEVLDDAHGNGVVHRDLKPDNVLIARRAGDPDFVKVVDFGLARLAEAPDAIELTTQGMVLGTPAYMAPEQIQAETVDARADLYALGAMGYELTVGRRPFERDSVQAMLFAHLTDDLPLPSSLNRAVRVPAGLDSLLMGLMARDPAQRPASAAEVLAALDDITTEVLLNSGTYAAPIPPRPPRTGAAVGTADTDATVIGGEQTLLHTWEGVPVWSSTLQADTQPSTRGSVSAAVATRDTSRDANKPPREEQRSTTSVVGRESERLVLEEALDALVRAHQPRTVFVQGQPGIGKSRFLRWFCARARETAGVRVAVGHHREGNLAPLRGLSDVAGSLLGVDARGDDISTLRARLAEVVPGAAAGDAGEDATRFFLRLLRPEQSAGDARLRLDAVAQRAYIAGHIRRLVYSRAGENPLVLVFEDLHAADPTTRAVVADIAQLLNREPAPVLLVLVQRSSEGETSGRRDALDQLAARARGGPSAGTSHVTLGPLRESETAALAAERLPVTPDLARTIHRLSEGVPHVVFQLTAYLQEANLVRQTAAGWALLPGVDVAAILPPDLRELGALRVDQLLERLPDPRHARQVLEHGAVLGQRFPLGLLESALDESKTLPDREMLEDILDGLFDGDILTLEEESDDDWLSFTNQLVRETVVASLGATFRARRIHASAARAKEKLHGSAVPRVAREIAEHYRRARKPGRALELTLVAARTAHRQSNDRESLACYEVAESLLAAAGAEARVAGDIRLEMGRLQHGFADYDDAEHALQRAEQTYADAELMPEARTAQLERAAVLAARGSLKEALELAEAVAAASATTFERAAASTRLGELYRLQGDLDAARRHLDEALAACPPDDYELRAEILLYMGLKSVTRGRLTDAESTLGACLEVHRHIDVPQGRSRCLNALGVAAYFRGDSSKARQRYRDALAIAERIGDQAAVGRCVMNLGTIHHKEGRFAQAFEAYERSLSLFTAIGNRAEQANVEMNLGLALLEVGELNEAEEHLAVARRIFESIGDRLGAATTDSHRASAFIRSGRLEPAEMLLLRALDHAEELGAESHAPGFLVMLSRVERERGDLRKARGYARRALALLLKQGRGGDEAIAKSALAAAQRDRSEDVKHALTLLREARDSLEAQSDLRHIIEVDLRLGDLLARTGRTTDAEQILSASLERAERTGFLNADVVRAYERVALLARDRGDLEFHRRAVTRRDAAAARVVAGGGHIRPDAG